MKKNKKAPVSAATDTGSEANTPTKTPSVYHENQKAQEGILNRPAYYAIIPAKVRYDPELRPNAKLLYAEITALANERGYCFATNGYLADLFGITDRTARDLIAQLCERGYISVDVVRDESKAVTERRLYVDTPRVAEAPPEKNFHPSGKKSPDPPEKNFRVYKNNNTRENIPPIVPQGGRCRREIKKTADWKPERFEGFWKFYPRGENKQGAIRAWDRLQPSDELIAQMAIALKRQTQTESWRQGIGIPYASTWLNNARWEDDVREAVPEQGGWADDPEVI